MSSTGKAPAAPRLRAIREAWLREVISHLEGDREICAAGFVGSLGRGRADDWSDVDILIVVADDQVDGYADASRLPSSEQVALSWDTRHHAPRGAGAVSGQYLVDGLPLWVDWYVYPMSSGAWVADAKVIFDRPGLPRLSDTFDDHLAKRDIQPPTPKPATAHGLLQIALVPVAAKRIARRSEDTARMVEFVGGPHAPDASPVEYLGMLRGVVDRYRGDAPAESLAAARRYLDLVAEVLEDPLNR
jgi:hypothetical protein